MRKKWILAILFLIFILSIGVYILTFVSPFSNKKQIGDERKELGKKIELTFWRNYGTKAENNAFQELVSSFESAHPSIRIKLVSIPFGDYEMRLRTELVAGNAPDIMSIDSPNLALYADSGLLLSLDPYMKKEDYIQDIPSSTLKGLTYKNEIYLAPIVESGIALFYNKKLFKEAGLAFPSEDPYKPLTWVQVLDMAKKMTDSSKNIYGIDPAQGFSDGEGPAYFKMPLLWQFGGDILNKEGTTATGFLNSDESIEALQFYQDLYQKYHVASIELPEDPFVNGHLAMSVLGSWTLADYKINHPEFKLGEEFGIAPIPKGIEQVVPNGGWAVGISAKTNYPKEAWEFVQYISSYEGIKKYVKETGDIPARYSVAEELAELKVYPKNIFVEQAQSFSKNRPVTPAYPVVSDEIRKLFEEVGISNQNVKIAADKAVERINKGLQENINQ
ncbi:ABC transporter substrate-binding protein [Niallia sp. 03133]|uniref:ABC transporter substrate-binding protein n=1 Tax=Niallia sp. 03133 TaxID=3458060 RepID=UPI004044763F